jgi:hypothetical protein
MKVRGGRKGGRERERGSYMYVGFELIIKVILHTTLAVL